MNRVFKLKNKLKLKMEEKIMFMIYERSMNKPCKVTIKDNEASFEPQKTIKTATCFPDKMYKDFEKNTFKKCFLCLYFSINSFRRNVAGKFYTN